MIVSVPMKTLVWQNGLKWACVVVVFSLLAAWGAWSWTDLLAQRRAVAESARNAEASREQMEQAMAVDRMRRGDEKIEQLTEANQQRTEKELREIDSQARIREAQRNADDAVRASDARAAELGIPR
jgi:biopolymer transport protein ExbB/TolQ